MTQTLTEFYNGKTLLITGAAGFFGTVLLEILLKCFPGIERIYILLRAKKDVKPMDRKESIFKKRIMASILKTNPEVFDKVHVVSGDVSQSNLGMSENDLNTICREVTIVFHCAALISFMKSFRDISLENSKGTYNVMELCRKLKQLHVFVYTSSAYSNSHLYQEKIYEKIYPMPYSAQRYLIELENGSAASFEELVSSSNIRWPNSYTFSKCLAENILKEMAADLPVVIMRPSIIYCTMEGSLPGYIESGSGVMELTVAIGKGFVRVYKVKKNAIFDTIPADYTANAHVVGAWSVATGRSPSFLIVHCSGGDVHKTTYEDCLKIGLDICRKHPVKNRFQTPSAIQVENRYAYFFLSIYKHYIPAVILDVYLYFKGSKIRLVKLYKFFDEMLGSLNFFMSRTFDFETKNFKSLSKHLSPEEREMVYTDLNCTFHEMMANLPFGFDAFEQNLDRTSLEKHDHAVFVRTMLIEVAKKLVLVLFCYLIYLFIVKVLF